MNIHTSRRRPAVWIARLAIGLGSAVTVAAVLHAQEDTESGVTLTMRPHCEDGYDNDTWIYGEQPAPGWVIDPEDPERCAPFTVVDPQTRQTPMLAVGDILDLDLVVENPNEIDIATVGAWINYDPAYLRGLAPIETAEEFPLVTPGESDFDEAAGQAKIEVSAEPDEAPSGYWVPVARLRFEVLQAGVTPLTFFDDQPGGKTHVVSTEENEEGDDLTLPLLGALMVRLEGGDGSPTSASSGLPPNSPCQSDSECQSGLCHFDTCQYDDFFLPDGAPCRQDDQCQSNLCGEGACVPAHILSDPFYDNPDSLAGIGDICSYSADCQSGICFEGTCQEGGFLVPEGGSCLDDPQCQSGDCQNGFCNTVSASVASSSQAASVASSLQALLPNGSGCLQHAECGSGFCQEGLCAEPPVLQAVGAACAVHEECQSQFCMEGICRTPGDTGSPTAFGLLQVHNLRVTTAGTVAYLGWDPLQSSRLKAYNLYYGTTVGQYIQRKTISGTEASLVLRDLPEGTPYFFAIKAVSANDEESAFSQEVSVVIGDPTTSSAPLSLSLQGSVGGNPLSGGTSVPGETGAPSVLALFLIISAGVGTAFASRRQTYFRALS